MSAFDPKQTLDRFATETYSSDHWSSAMASGPQIPYWISLTQALATPAIALAAAIVAAAQWRLATRRYDLDLFERRYKVFDAVRSVILAAMNEQELTIERANEHLASTSDAVFLFDERVLEYLDGLRQLLMFLIVLQTNKREGKYPNMNMDSSIVKQQRIIGADLEPGGRLLQLFDEYLSIGRKRKRYFWHWLKRDLLYYKPSAIRYRRFLRSFSKRPAAPEKPVSVE